MQADDGIETCIWCAGSEISCVYGPYNRYGHHCPSRCYGMLTKRCPEPLEDDMRVCLWCERWYGQHWSHCPFRNYCYEEEADDHREFHFWYDERGILCWRRRDFLWMIPRLLAWSRRAIARIEAEYAPDGPRGRQIIQEWSALSNE